MKYISQILYGCIIGNFIMKVLRRLVPEGNRGRYVILAMHTMQEEFIMVGRCGSHEHATELADMIEDRTINYIGLVYDMYLKEDLQEVQSKLAAGLMRGYADNPDDQGVLLDIGELCDIGDI
jgi:hypothetical protein